MGEASVSTVVWRPQSGPQKALIDCPVFEVFYGGARGGGKTDGSLGEWGLHQERYGPHAKGVFFRRELPQLDAAIARAKEIYLPLGAEWKEQAKTFVFPKGGVLRFRPLERDSDAEKYQGQDYTRVYFEELTNWPDPRPVDKLKACLRSAHGVPCRFRATGNPGGPGHTWVKARYIDPGAYNIVREHGLSRVYIPARLEDNRILMGADPTYAARLRQAGSAELVRAWLEGDWDIVEGAFFDCWRSDRHVLRPFPIADDWRIFRALDWGSAAPFSVGWWAIASDDYEAENMHGDSVLLQRGALIRVCEWYGAAGPNKGLKLTVEQVAGGILERDPRKEIDPGVADPAIFAEDGGPSMAERFRRMGLHFRPADNKRVAARGAMGGWDQMRARLIGSEDGPMLATFSTCRDSIRTIPALPHDRNRPEDVDTDAEDHAADEWRYACMSRPWIRSQRDARPAKPNDRYTRSRNEERSWRTV